MRPVASSQTCCELPPELPSIPAASSWGQLPAAQA